MKKSPAVLALAISTLLTSSPAFAANLYWDGTGTNWDSVDSWSTDPALPNQTPAAVPGLSDLAFFNITAVEEDEIVRLDANQSALGLVMNSPYEIRLLGNGGDRVLTIGTSGIVMNTFAGGLIIGSPGTDTGVLLSLQGSQTWANNSGATNTYAMIVHNDVSAANAGPMTLTLGGDTTNTVLNEIRGSVSDGSGTLSLTMTGTSGTRWALAGANSYSGLTNISSGGLRVAHNLALGSTAAGTVVSGGASLLLENADIAGEALTLTGSGVNNAGSLQSVLGASHWRGSISTNTGGTGGVTRIGATGASTLIVDGNINATGSGQLVFQTGSSNTDTGVIIVNGNISYPGQRLTKSVTGQSSGTVILNGNNDYGDTTISSGLLQVGNGGTTGTLGSGTVSMAGILAFNRSDDIVVPNVITGNGTISQRGSGTVTLTGANGHQGATSITGSGTLELDFGGLETPTNLVGTGKLTLNGGTLRVTAKNTGATSQTFSNTDISLGKNSIVVNSNGGESTELNLGTIARGVGGVLKFTLPTAGTIKTSNTATNGILGGYATVGDDSWATVDASGNVGALASYTSDAWAMGNNTTVTMSSAPAADSKTNTLRFDANADATVTLTGADNRIEGGGILMTPNVGNNRVQISGGTLLGALDRDLIIIQNNTAAGLTISSTIGSSLTKAGNGLLTLSGGNGGNITTRILAGTISVTSPSPLGGQGGTAAIVFPIGSTGVLQLAGNNLYSSTKGVTLLGNGTIDVPIHARMGNQKSATGAGNFIKTGAGTLEFTSANLLNDYTGATIVKGGIIQLNTLVLGGFASGLGASSSEAKNLVLDGGGIRFASTTLEANTDRLFTLGTGGGTIEASGGQGLTTRFINPGSIEFIGGNSPRTLNLGGTNTGENLLTPALGDAGTGATALLKSGVGSWTLAGDNSYSGGTIVAAGSLSGAVDGAFGTGDVTVQISASQLTIQTGVLDAINDSATLSLAGDGVANGTALAGYAFLAAGVNEFVGGLVLGGVTMTMPGSYGATGSGATFIHDDYFQGTGVVTVIPEPGSITLLATSLGLFGGFGRMRFRRQARR